MERSIVDFWKEQFQNSKLYKEHVDKDWSHLWTNPDYRPKIVNSSLVDQSIK